MNHEGKENIAYRCIDYDVRNFGPCLMHLFSFNGCNAYIQGFIKVSLIASFSLFIVTFWYLDIPVYAAENITPTSKWLQPQRKTLELPELMPFPPHRASTDHRDLTSKMFDKPEVCGACHTTIYQQWRTSVMSRSWDDPIYLALLKRASKATDGDLNNFCTGCHTPIGLTTGQIDTQEVRTPDTTSPLPGVDCESCHNMSARTGIDNGAYVLTPNAHGRPTKFGPRENATSPYHDTVYSPLHLRSDFCGTCHNVTHPVTGVPVERTYDEWQESPYNSASTECQDCHMTPFKGKAASMGPEREAVASHWFSGGNVSLLEHFGEKEAAERSRAMLRSAGVIDIISIPESVQTGQVVSVQVKVTNTGTGHKLPTGFPEGREVWIDFQVTDKNDEQVYRLGQIEDGQTESGTKNFKVHLGDKNGDEVELDVWLADKILFDNRILPKGYQVVEYNFLIPEEIEGPLTIRADLNYWPFPQKIVDFLLGEGEMQVEVTQIATATVILNTDSKIGMSTVGLNVLANRRNECTGC